MSQTKELIYARKRANLYRNLIIILTLLFLVIGFLSLLILPFTLGLIVFIIWLLYPHYTMWSRGATGEESISGALDVLKNDYLVVNDILLLGTRGNIDHIVIGKNGIFVIETKSHKGHIICEGDYWIQQKIGRRGTLYEPHIGSPSKQIKKNAIALRNFFEENFPKLSHIWINCIVVFTNETTTLELRKPTVTVLDTEKLVDHIKNNKSKIAISQDDFSKLETIFQDMKQNQIKQN